MDTRGHLKESLDQMFFWNCRRLKLEELSITTSVVLCCCVRIKELKQCVILESVLAGHTFGVEFNGAFV